MREDDLKWGYFQQGEATEHTATETIKYVQEFYGERLISRGLWYA